MKQQILITALSALVLSSCDNMSGFFKGETDNTAINNEGVYIAARDFSITPANAYSDLFLDSTAMEQFIQQQKIGEEDAREIRNFYNERNYQYAWFASEGITEHGRNFWNIYDSSIDSVNNKIDKHLDQRMDSLIMNDSIVIQNNDSALLRIELMLTKEFVHFAKVNGNNSNLFHDIIPTRKYDVMQMADSVLNKANQNEQFNNKRLSALRDQLNKYYTIAKQGGWPLINLTSRSIKKGASSPSIVEIKRRLMMTGDYNGNDTTAQYNDSLEVAIKSYQQRHGFNPDGNISDSLVRTMNVPVETRIQQLLINMNRLAWSPVNQQHNQLIEVNLPAYMLHVYENNNKAFDMPVVVGKQGTHTTMFTGNLNQIVFSPYWNIPESIVKNEILPAMQRDPNYLKKNNMEIVSQNDSVPKIRQLPGKDNAMGRVKFLFPNNFDIYFHDTPNKSLFNQKDRALSHGCIRLADATRMTQYLLRNQSEWTPEKIQQAMNGNKEQTVVLQNPVPVVITYLTAWVDDSGKLNFREDIYKHDEKTSKRMFTNSSYAALHHNQPQHDTMRNNDTANFNSRRNTR